jgi:AAA domain
MPQPASSIEREPHMRVLLMGAAKCGKSTSTITSLVKLAGQGYVMCCGDKSGMSPAARRTSKFQFDVVRDENEMEAGIKEARRGTKEGEYKWIFVDDFSLYASFLEGALRDASAKLNKSGEPDGRRYWPEYKTRLLNVPRRLFELKAHVIFATHFIEQSQEIDGQRAKSGVGIVPMIGGSAREELPALFQDVVFMEKEKDRRVFKLNPEGVWGPGCRSTDETKIIDADFGEFLKAAREADKKAVSDKGAPIRR